MRVNRRGSPARDAQVYTVTDARRPMSEDIGSRQRRYLISMGVRTACLLIAILMAGHAPMWAMVIPVTGAIVLPYISVVVANGGREPEDIGFVGHDPESDPQKRISPGHPEIHL